MKYFKWAFISVLILNLLGPLNHFSWYRKLGRFFFLPHMNLFTHLEGYQRIPVELEVWGNENLIWSNPPFVFLGIDQGNRLGAFIHALAKQSELPEDISPYFLGKELADPITIKGRGFFKSVKFRHTNQRDYLKLLNESCSTGEEIDLRLEMKFRSFSGEINQVNQIVTTSNCSKDGHGH